MRILIDPGHGGDEPGAVSETGVEEKTINLAIGLSLKHLIDTWFSDVKVYMTRHSDVQVSQDERGSMSRVPLADLVISIHANASRLPEVEDMMCFHWPGNKRGAAVARAIQRAAPAGLESRYNRGPYPATKVHWPRVRYVLRHHLPTVVLVELGFMTNKEDLKLLTNPAMQDEICVSILCGVTRARTMISRKAW